MRREELQRLLEEVRAGHLEIAAALERFKGMPFEDLQYAKIDHHREIRRGFPEIIFCAGKTDEQILGIARGIRDKGHAVLGTRCPREQFHALSSRLAGAQYFPDARIFFIPHGEVEAGSTEKIVVVTAGTADIPVAEEAAVTAECLGITTERIYDVGVAGIHRLFPFLDRIGAAAVVIAVAGMEGALPGILAGLTDRPVIAVPTSVGYGASFHGVAPLLAMLNSCAGGIGVVNIDNGFGAAYLAALIVRRIEAAARPAKEKG